MESKLPLKSQYSNMVRTGIPKPSGLPKPSKRSASPPENESSNKKRRLVPPKPTLGAVPPKPKGASNLTRPFISTSWPNAASRQPNVKPAVKPTTRPTARAPVRAPPVKPAAAKPKPAPVKPAAPKVAQVTGTRKRQPWDMKGRLLDMEAAIAKSLSQNEGLTTLISSSNGRIAQLEVLNQQLEGTVQVKEQMTSQASERITDLQTKLRISEDEISSISRRFQQKIEDLEFAKSSVERQRDTLDGELRASRQEVSSMKSTIATMTAANAGTKAELENTKMLLDQARSLIQMKDSTITDRNAKIKSLETIVEEQSANIRENETTRRKLHNTIQELKGNIRVFCRVRPLLGEEMLGNDGEISHMSFPDNDNKVLELAKVSDLSPNETLANLPKKDSKYCFSFDRVFGPSSSQEIVFDDISQLVQSSLDGYNVCIFAYGQTGSGKTFTMEGPSEKNSDDRGMIPRAVEQIFATADELSTKAWQYDFEASFLEIYNETIRDLLGNGREDEKHEIKMVSKDSTEVMVTNITSVKVTSQDQVHQLLSKATQNRAVAETKCNERSSRSHSVFRLRLTGINKVTEEKCLGNLNLIDLAGSERLKESGSQGARLKETQCINKSLANLGNVIMALANKDPHIPYRNSRLTHLLQHSLGGNSKTLMFVNVSPREDYMGETICSLRFATKVNACNIGTAQKKVK